jgi:beta-lactamase regulating signal transducer with metallopeptidase domain
MIGTLGNAVLWISASQELSLLVKATVIILAALLIARLASRARAAARHVVMATAFAALLALPILVAIIPAIAIEVPAAPRAESIATIERSPSVTSPVSAVSPAETTRTSAWPNVSVGQALRLTWVAGTIVFLLPVVAALWRLSMIRRTGLPVAWHRAELARLADARGVSLPVELLEHEAVPGPMTFGISKPVIVLPLDAREWSEAELRCALMHEIEHIQRGDWLMQIVARTVAAFYWFHPLVWTAWRRLCLEAERSCDDAVVMSEERTEYAEQLVTLAQRMSSTPVQPMLGMANRSDLSTRVTAVLDDRLRRGRAGFMLAAGTVTAAAAIVISVAPVRAISRTEPAAVAAEDQASRLGNKIQAQRTPGLRKSRALDVALFEAAREGDIDGVKELLAAGANASAKIEGDGSPLMGAAEAGRVDILRLLLDAGADPNGVVEGDGSPLIKAAQRGVLEQVQLLIDRGADVNLAVQGDENPLMGAAEGGHLAIVQLLVSRGADIHIRIQNDRYDGGTEWRTAIGQARRNGHSHVVKYLESLGARE